jgi:hypothetical protein
MNNIVSPRTDDTAIEQEIKAKGLTAPRVTPADIEANIYSVKYFTANEGMRGTEASLDTFAETGSKFHDPALTLLTFCVIGYALKSKLSGGAA